jgi:four helix bundle protein
LHRFLCDEKKEFVLAKQIVRSGTSIGANVEEAIGGQSSKDFLSKMSIAYKEAHETHYWLMWACPDAEHEILRYGQERPILLLTAR